MESGQAMDTKVMASGGHVALLLNFHRINEWATEGLEITSGTIVFSIPGFHALATSHPQNLEYILKTNSPNFIKGQKYRETMLDFLGESIILSNGDRLQKLTRCFHAALRSLRFRESAQATAQDFIESELVEEINRASRTPSIAVDFEELFNRFTFSLMAKAGVDVDPDVVGFSKEFPHAFDVAADMSVVRNIMPSFEWKFMKFVNVGTERRLSEALSIVDRWLESAIKCKINNDHSHGDLLSLILEQDSRPHDESSIRGLVLSIILAGKDTVTSCLSWFIYALSMHPNVEQNIYDEVCSIVKRRPCHEEKIGRFSNEDIREMEYLHAALSEVLRLYPPIPLNILEAARDDVLPDGSFIRKGTAVIYFVYAYGRSESAWGKDACEFKPERWLKNGKFAQRSELKFMAFNAGTRRCLGKDFAYWLMKCVVASLVLRFKVRLAPQPLVVPKLSISMGMKHGLPLMAEKRSLSHRLT